MTEQRQTETPQPASVRVLEPERFQHSQVSERIGLDNPRDVFSDGEAGRDAYERTMYLKDRAEQVTNERDQPNRSKFGRDLVALSLTLVIAVFVTVANGFKTVRRWVSRVR